MTLNELENSWNYYLSIEKDLNETSRYIEPTGQETTFSFEFYKIIMLSCAEVESTFKKICQTIDNDKTYGNIADYKGAILGKYPHICDTVICVPRWDAKNICPFDGWDKGKLHWWDAYQDIKHSRFGMFDKANYMNAVYSLGALYVLILYLYKINGYDCYADRSLYFTSDYYSIPLYVKQASELPDFRLENETDSNMEETI